MTERGHRYSNGGNQETNVVHEKSVYLREIGHITAQNPAKCVGDADD
jgi:hypothetical protein